MKDSNPKLTKEELIELANFLYSRYEHRKRLKNDPKPSIIKKDTIHKGPK